jgi:hypothetical protein
VGTFISFEYVWTGRLCSFEIREKPCFFKKEKTIQQELPKFEFISGITAKLVCLRQELPKFEPIVRCDCQICLFTARVAQNL